MKNAGKYRFNPTSFFNNIQTFLNSLYPFQNTCEETFFLIFTRQQKIRNIFYEIEPNNSTYNNPRFFIKQISPSRKELRLF